MKILHLNTEKTWRGGEQQTLYLLESLKQRHVKSHLVCQPASLLAERALAADIEVFPIAMRGETDLAAARHLHKLIRKFNYDIAHSHTSHAHSLAYLASIGCKTCRLVTRRVDFSIFRRSFLRLSAIKYRRMADYYIAISHKIKKVMVADGIASDRIFVVHSGVDLKRFEKDSGNHLIAEFNLKPDEKVVINVAHLTGHKGQQFLVRAIPLVVKKFPRVRFFIVGEGELLAELKALAA
ncbi:MAG: glycosyltransferase, partial [Desulfobacterales bacterium]